jgi:hypothetical protein
MPVRSPVAAPVTEVRHGNPSFAEGPRDVRDDLLDQREEADVAFATGSLTILKDHLRRMRPNFVAAQAYQRTSYLPGELAQTDWWEPGIEVPVGKGQTRAVFGLVTGLPFSAAFRIVFAFNQTVAAFCPALVGGLSRLGGLPKAMVSDNDACIVASRRGGQVRLVDEVPALYGQPSADFWRGCSSPGEGTGREHVVTDRVRLCSRIDVDSVGPSVGDAPATDTVSPFAAGKA